MDSMHRHEPESPLTVRSCHHGVKMEHSWEASEWRRLLLNASHGLQLGIVACNGYGPRALAQTINLRMVEGLQALEHLQQMLPQMADHCEKLKSRATAVEVALAAARAELAGTQNDERLARHEARHDALTLLPNRRHFLERLEHAVLRTKASGTGLAVFYLDLDGFKSVNDLHGHEVGDKLLQIVASRMNRHARREDVVSRLGGDEFACFRQGNSDRAQLRSWAEKLYQLISEPMKVGDLTLAVVPSIGVSQHPGDGLTPAELLRSSDAAMYRAKRAGSRVDFFAVCFEEESARQLAIPVLKM